MPKKARSTKSQNKNLSSFQNFIDVTAKVWKKYLRGIYELDKMLMDGGLLLYPNVALFIETGKY